MILLTSPLIYITFCILLQFFVEVKSQKTIFSPDSRDAHTATFINDKLYILGGEFFPSPAGKAKSPKETFLYLDVSVPFNTNELKWVDLTSKNIVPPHRYAASIKGGENNNTLFLYGGESLNSQPMALVYTFDTQSNSWRIPAEITGILQTGKSGVTLTIDYNNGMIYKFGGFVPTAVFNDMLILDSVNLSWKKASSINAPSPRHSYGAVFLPNRNIIYMGMYIF
jgi:N-acetylneuraminic acid mutarotase